MKKNLNKEGHFIEYEEAPSGGVLFYSYKEPLIKFSEGHGFYGALIYDAVSEKIQCHFCGKWFDIMGNHLHAEHGMTASEYKARVGLNKKTALVNEAARTKMIAKGMKRRLKNLRPNKRHTKATRTKISRTLQENRAEMQNLHGTCPDQLIDRLQKLEAALKRTPTQDEVPFLNTLCKVYGNYASACKLAGLTVRKNGEHISNIRTDMRLYRREQAKKWIRGFYEINKHKPTYGEAVAQGYSKSTLRDFRVLVKDALMEDGIWRPYKEKHTYTKEQLLAYIRTFIEVNNRNPSVSDCRRLLLPPASTYYYRFGTLKKAIVEATKFVEKSPLFHLSEDVNYSQV